jgi:hypothetical protein
MVDELGSPARVVEHPGSPPQLKPRPPAHVPDRFSRMSVAQLEQLLLNQVISSSAGRRRSESRSRKIQLIWQVGVPQVGRIQSAMGGEAASTPTPTPARASGARPLLRPGPVPVLRRAAARSWSRCTLYFCICRAADGTVCLKNDRFAAMKHDLSILRANEAFTSVPLSADVGDPRLVDSTAPTRRSKLGHD